MRFYEIWITERYGEISFSDVTIGPFAIHVASVAVLNGVAIGMGATRQWAIVDLYEDLRCGPIETPLKGFWRDRREKLKSEGIPSNARKAPVHHVEA
jgi:hypothetical protein